MAHALRFDGFQMAGGLSFVRCVYLQPLYRPVAYIVLWPFDSISLYEEKEAAGIKLLRGHRTMPFPDSFLSGTADR